jgi:anti-sigma-K factor RskA
VAASCIGALIYLGTLIQQPASIATIDGGGHRHFVATVDAKRGTIAVAPAAFSADATRVPELWLIPSDSKPRPLGILRADRTVTITVPAELWPLAVSNAVLAGVVGAAPCLPNGPAHWTGDCNWQAHQSVNASLHP